VVGEFEEGGFASGAVSRLLPHQQGILQQKTQTGSKLLCWSQQSVFPFLLIFLLHNNQQISIEKLNEDTKLTIYSVNMDFVQI